MLPGPCQILWSEFARVRQLVSSLLFLKFSFEGEYKKLELSEKNIFLKMYQKKISNPKLMNIQERKNLQQLD